MKVGEIVQRIQSLYSKGVNSDDSRLMSRHIYNKLLTVRARLISQEAKKKQRISQWNYQTIPCVELIKVSTHDCPCIPPIGCEILRSKYKLPEPLSGLSGSLIQSVTSIDRSIKIDEITFNAINSQKGNKYTSKKINYFIHNNYLYISTFTKIQIVSITALFEDPIDAKKFIGMCDTECIDCNNCIDYLEENFPIDNDLIDAMIELSMTELIQIFGQNTEDLTNNSRDSLKEQSK
jgi:hypothetical protein